MNSLYEILITMGAVVAAIVLATLVFIYRQKAIDAGTDSEGGVEEKLAGLSQALSDIKERQLQIPTAIAEGQLKGLESVQAQFNNLINTVQSHLLNVGKQLSEGQSETGRILDRKLEGTISAVNKQLNEVAKTLNNQLSSAQGNINKNLETNSNVITEVNRRLGALSETAKEMEAVGKDIGKLQDLLKVPKFRGNIGELFLGNLLKEIIPSENYELQFKFRNNTQVDAVIKLANGIIPVDSKFPLESFNKVRNAEDDSEKSKYRKEFIRTVKERINEIAEKYINPKEGTFDFALMYVPAENVYYEMMIGTDFEGNDFIRNYAWEKKVFPVSPNTIYTYLVVISMGLKGMRVEKNAEKIIGNLSEIQSLYRKFNESFTSMRKNVDMLSRKYEESEKYSEQMGMKLESITEKKLELAENSDDVINEEDKTLEKDNSE